MGLDVLCLRDCGANLMGTYGVVLAEVWDLWGSMGCCHCDANLMGIYGVVVAAVLWDFVANPYCYSGCGPGLTG